MGLNLALASKDATIRIETKAAGWLVVSWHDRFVDRFAGMDVYEIGEMSGSLDLTAKGLGMAYLMLYIDCGNDFETAKNLGVLNDANGYEIDEHTFDTALKFVANAYFLDCGAYGSY